MLETRIALIRHAHTSANSGVHRVMSGIADVPLSALGLQQVEALRRYAREHEPYATVYSSPLRRALETAAAISSTDPAAPRPRPGLCEIDCGAVDGLSLEEVETRYPELWAKNLRQNDDDFRWPGGESYRELRERCLRELEAIGASHLGDRVALVTHAGVISQLLGHLMGRRPGEWEAFRVENTSITEILWRPDRIAIISLDERPHLVRAEPSAFTTTPRPRDG